MATIRVDDQVRAKVAKIAETNFRGIGDQVAFWAETSCEHPQENRIPLNVVVSPIMEPTKDRKLAQVGKGQSVRGFFCAQCRQTVLANASEEITAALNIPLIGGIK